MHKPKKQRLRKTAYPVHKDLIRLEENMEERITELELRFMHQEKTIQELNDTVYRQEQAIIRIERELAILREQVCTLSPSALGETSEEEPPPHY